ncbi:MAG: hypothetical protein NTZ73_02870 [Candidatus Diapherotrites archaeon]|nr:hypothetical protein [Candidatus Diapherotrites archaeon]
MELHKAPPRKRKGIDGILVGFINRRRQILAERETAVGEALLPSVRRIYSGVAKSRTRDSKNRIKRWYFDMQIDLAKRLGFKVRAVKLPKK